MKLVLILAACLFAGIALAESRQQVPQYPYPSEPQYQYLPMDTRGEKAIKCPKGLRPYQGECRKWRRTD